MSSFTSDLIVRVTTKKMRGRTVYVLEKAFEYRVRSFDDPSEIVSVPVGFATDFMSFPSLFRIFFDNAHRSKAAVVHDYLLSTGRKPAEADAIFREALGVLGAGKIERNFYYGAVRLTSMVKQLLRQPVY